MGCGQSSNQVEDISDRKPDGTRRPSSKPVADDDGAVATTMDELDNSDYTIIRLLLLGAAESGKTTLLEQIRLLYKQNYSDSELFHRKAFIYNNILQTIRVLIIRMGETDTDYTDKENAELAEKIMEEEDTQYACFTMEIQQAICKVWSDPAVQEVYGMRSEMNLNDSTKYFLDHLADMNSVDYIPSPKDLIMTYVPTVGVQNVIFTANNRAFQLFDMGGQRIDRRKWATMYDGIDAIFFCLAVSEYDQTMNEDMVTNRLNDSLLLLKKISEERKFTNTPLFLFLNEIDVFREKLKVIPLEDYQPDYDGSSVGSALDFIETLARQAVDNRDPSLLHLYRTNCTDTESMSNILEKVFKTILKGN